MAAVTPDRSLDCVGLFCPVPILRVRQALEPLRVGEVLELLADDPAAEGDLTRWAARTGHALLAVDKHGAVLRFLVRKTR
jgi:TusA-related sulfurtransferase